MGVFLAVAFVVVVIALRNRLLSLASERASRCHQAAVFHLDFTPKQLGRTHKTACLTLCCWYALGRCFCGGHYFVYSFVCLGHRRSPAARSRQVRTLHAVLCVSADHPRLEQYSFLERAPRTLPLHCSSTQRPREYRKRLNARRCKVQRGPA